MIRFRQAGGQRAVLRMKLRTSTGLRTVGRLKARGAAGTKLAFQDGVNLMIDPANYQTTIYPNYKGVLIPATVTMKAIKGPIGTVTLWQWVVIAGNATIASGAATDTISLTVPGDDTQSVVRCRATAGGGIVYEAFATALGTIGAAP